MTREAVTHPILPGANNENNANIISDNSAVGRVFPELAEHGNNYDRIQNTTRNDVTKPNTERRTEQGQQLRHRPMYKSPESEGVAKKTSRDAMVRSGT